MRQLGSSGAPLVILAAALYLVTTSGCRQRWQGQQSRQHGSTQQARVPHEQAAALCQRPSPHSMELCTVPWRLLQCNMVRHAAPSAGRSSKVARGAQPAAASQTAGVPTREAAALGNARWRGSPPRARGRSRTQTWFKTAAQRRREAGASGPLQDGSCGGRRRQPPPPLPGQGWPPPASPGLQACHRRPGCCGLVPGGGACRPGPRARHHPLASARLRGSPPAVAPAECDARMQYARAMKGGRRARAGRMSAPAWIKAAPWALWRGCRPVHAIIGGPTVRSDFLHGWGARRPDRPRSTQHKGPVAGRGPPPAAP